MDARNLRLRVGFGKAVVIDGPHIEIAAVATAGEVSLRHALGQAVDEDIGPALIGAQAVVLDKGRVGRKDSVPSPGPFIAQRELSRGFDAAAEVPIAWSGRAVGAHVGSLVELIDAAGADRIGAVNQPLAKLGAHQHTLAGQNAGRERRIVIGGQRPIIRNLDAKTVGGAAADERHQEAGLALHGRIGRGEVRHIGDWLAEELQARILEIDHLLAGVVDHPRRLDLPQRRLFGIVLASLAGGVHAAVHHGEGAARPIGAGGRHARLVGRVETQRIDEAVPEIVAEIECIGVGNPAVRLGDTYVAFRLHALGGLVVGHLVGLDGGAVLIDLHIADSGDALVVVVVMNLDRLQQHRRFFALRTRRGFLDRRPYREVHELSLRRRNIKPAAGNDRCRAPQDQAALLHSLTPQRRARGGAAHHQPSSWYNKTTNPVMAPIAAGIHAAIIGGRSSALLRSSVSFDMM